MRFLPHCTHTLNSRSHHNYYYKTRNLDLVDLEMDWVMDLETDLVKVMDWEMDLVKVMDLEGDSVKVMDWEMDLEMDLEMDWEMDLEMDLEMEMDWEMDLVHYNIHINHRFFYNVKISVAIHNKNLYLIMIDKGLDYLLYMV